MLSRFKINPFIFSICFFGLFLTLRLVFLGDPSKFIVAGSDFFDENIWNEKIHINKGQGYDGQFFFHYANAPFKTKFDETVLVDLPPYRHQRIIYPIIAHVFSFGQLELLPVALILTNFLAVIGIGYFLFLILKGHNLKPIYSWIPLLTPGLLMSISRDLSEAVALFWVVGAFYFIAKEKLGLFSLFASLAILTRETEIILIAPMALGHLIKTQKKTLTILFSGIPLLVLFVWKFIVIKNWYPNYESPLHNFTFLFWGLIHSFLINLKFTNFRDILEFGFWISYVLLFFWILGVGVRDIFNSKTLKLSSNQWIILFGIVFCLFFSEAIYIDDWAFVRVLSGLIFFALLYIVKQNKISKYLFLFLLINVSFTFARLAFRI